MEPQPPADGLLAHDLVIMQQISSVLANDFDILDTSGAVIGRFAGQESMGLRLFAGPREFTLFDGDGTALLNLHDVPNFGFDTFELTAPNGALVATLKKRLSLFRKVVDLTTGDGTSLQLRGGFWDFDYEILDGQGAVARVNREWAGMAHGFMGRSRYAVSLAPQLPAGHRLLILGAVVALDLIRMKEARSNDA